MHTVSMQSNACAQHRRLPAVFEQETSQQTQARASHARWPNDPSSKVPLLRNLPQNQLLCDVIFGHHVLAGFLHEVGTMVGATMVGAVDL